MKATKKRVAAIKKSSRRLSVKAKAKSSKKLRVKPAKKATRVAKQPAAAPETPIAIYEVVETSVYEEPAIVIVDEEEQFGT